MTKTVLAVVGPMAAGKGTVIEILKKKGFESSSTSDRIREEIRRRGMEVNRDSLTLVANDLRTTFGNEILAKRTIEFVDASPSNYFVIDSIRNPNEIAFFKEKYDMKIIAVTADQHLRFKRFSERTTNSEPMSFDRFKEIDDKELYGSQGEHSQRVSDCMKLADVTLENDGSVENLENKINEALHAFGIKIN